MRRLKSAFLILAGSLVIFANTALAEPFSSICIVMGYGDKEDDAINEFGWNATPWLYLRLPSETGFVLKTDVFSDWYYGGDSSPSSSKNGSHYLSGLYEYWLKLDNWWNEGTQTGVKKEGSWSVLARFSTYSDSSTVISSGEGNAVFTILPNVIPEPNSSALFLLGGALLAVRQYRKTKRV